MYIKYFWQEYLQVALASEKHVVTDCPIISDAKFSHLVKMVNGLLSIVKAFLFFLLFK